jgi:hypothetical protein
MPADGLPGAVFWPLVAPLPPALAAVPLLLDRPATAPLAVPDVEVTVLAVVVALANVILVDVAEPAGNVVKPDACRSTAVGDIAPPPVVPPPLAVAPPLVVPPPNTLVELGALFVVVELVAVTPGTVLRGVVLPTLPKPNRLFGVALLVMLLVVPFPVVPALVPAVVMPF